MALTSKLSESLLQRGFSRRHIARISMGAAAAIPFFNEFAMAQQAEQQQAAVAGGARRGGAMGGGARAFDPEVGRITSNENPMGPCKEGREALIKGTEKFSEPPPLSDQKKTLVDHATLVLAKLNWKVGLAGFALVALVAIFAASFWAWRHHQKSDPLKNLPPAVYQPAGGDDTLPLHK